MPAGERVKFLKFLERNKGGGEEVTFRKPKGVFYTERRITRLRTYSRAA